MGIDRTLTWADGVGRPRAAFGQGLSGKSVVVWIQVIRAGPQSVASGYGTMWAGRW